MSIVRQHVHPKDDRPCMCRICNCGRHECPGMAKMAPLNANSGYREDYTGKQLDANDRLRGGRGLSNFSPTRAAPGHFTTTNQAAHDAGRNVPNDRAHSYKPTQANPQLTPFNGNSSYQVDYPGHDAGVGVRVGRPLNALQRTAAVPGAFETTNQAANNAITAAHRNGTFQRAHTSKGRDGGIMGGAPLNANSTYRQEYIPHPLDAQKVRPTDRGLWNHTNDGRDFLTTNGAAYRPPSRDTSAKCPASHVHGRPASSDGHIKLSEVPDAYGHMTPASDFMQSQPRFNRYALV